MSEMPSTTEHAVLLAEELDLVCERIGPHFPRAEPRDRARNYLRALLAPEVTRKTSWQIGKFAGVQQFPASAEQLGKAESSRMVFVNYSLSPRVARRGCHERIDFFGTTTPASPL
jgi:hypothetical protein